MGNFGWIMLSHFHNNWGSVNGCTAGQGDMIYMMTTAYKIAYRNLRRGFYEMHHYLNVFPYILSYGYLCAPVNDLGE